jgi:hypothetical protein
MTDLRGDGHELRDGAEAEDVRVFKRVQVVCAG